MFYKYSCSFWDENSEKEKTHSGIVHADTYKDAAAALEFHYGPMITSISIEETDETNVFEFEDNKNYFKYLFF